jgi:hypothetical protein
MSYPKQTSSTSLAISDNKWGEGGQSPSSVVTDPIIITREEDGVSYMQRLMVLGGPPGRGKVSHRHLQASSKETNMHTYPFNTPYRNSVACRHPITVHPFGISRHRQLKSNTPIPACASNSAVLLRSLGLGPTHHQHSRPLIRACQRKQHKTS